MVITHSFGCIGLFSDLNVVKANILILKMPQLLPVNVLLHRLGLGLAPR